MSNSYTHSLVDATAQILDEYAHNIRKLVRLEHGEKINLSIDYEKVNGASSQVMVVVFRDEDGDYFFNEHLTGDLNSAIEFYAMACAPVVKEAAVDEHGADRLEDVCRDFIGEIQASEEPEEENSCDAKHSIFSDKSLQEMIKYFPSNESENTIPVDDTNEDDEIIEIYHGGELVHESVQGKDAPGAASHPATKLEEAW